MPAAVCSLFLSLPAFFACFACWYPVDAAQANALKSSFFSQYMALFSVCLFWPAWVAGRLGRFGPDFPNTRCSGWAKSLLLPSRGLWITLRRRGAGDQQRIFRLFSAAKMVFLTVICWSPLSPKFTFTLVSDCFNYVC